MAPPATTRTLVAQPLRWRSAHPIFLRRGPEVGPSLFQLPARPWEIASMGTGIGLVGSWLAEQRGDSLDLAPLTRPGPFLFDDPYATLALDFGIELGALGYREVVSRRVR